MIINPAKNAPEPQLMQAISRTRLSFNNLVSSLANSAKTMPIEGIDYKDIRLVDHSLLKDGTIVPVKRMYIEFYYRIPADLPQEFWKKEWLNAEGQLKAYARFRFFLDLNRRKNASEEFRELQLAKVKALLSQEAGSPFYQLTHQAKLIEDARPPVVPLQLVAPVGLTMRQGITQWLKSYPDGSESQKAYTVLESLLESYWGSGYDRPLISFTTKDFLDMLQKLNNQKKWTKNTYNDKIAKLKNFLRKMKVEIGINIGEDLEKLKQVGKTRHAYYEDEIREEAQRLMLTHPRQPMGIYYFLWCAVIYYTCTRPDKETRQLQCGDIKWSRNQIYIDPKRAKGGEGGYIPLHPDLKKIFLLLKLDKKPKNYYIFGADGPAGPDPTNEAFFSNFWRNEIREPNNLEEKYTPYGWKHTRITDEYFSGTPLIIIQKLCRHASPEQTVKYIAELGLDPHQLQRKSKKVVQFCSLAKFKIFAKLLKAA